ncbi:MAG: flavodoxin family protein [Fretibacterium sp.]|nr:flavodoxin family protein [Fretibacterium sp.]
MKTAILYASVHHGNTKKVAEAMAETLDADLFDLTKQENADISGYDLIGFASGIYYSNMHKAVRKFAESATFRPDQKVFLVCTCGMDSRDFTKKVRKTLEDKQVEVLDSFRCRGFDTFGPLVLIGGIAKGRPNAEDLARAREYARNLAPAAH